MSRATESSKLIPKHSEDHPVPPPPLWQSLLGYAPISGAAIYFCWKRMVATGAVSQILASSTASYTGLRLVDKFIYANVEFYKLELAPSNPPFFGGYLSSIASIAFIPLIESIRKAVPRDISSPFIPTFVSQILGRGVTFPLWWANFVSSGGARRWPSRSLHSEIELHDAEAALLASILGFVVPGVGMTLTKSESWIFSWWMYPVTMSIIQKVYTYLRFRYSDKPKPSEIMRNRHRAYQLTMATYLVGFVYATSLHWLVLIPRTLHPSTLKPLLGLTFSTPGPNTPLTKIVYQTLQWDAVFFFGSAVVATLAFARNRTEAIKIAVWDLLSVAAFGTGGTIAGIWAWRERRLREDRQVYNRLEAMTRM